MNSLEPVTTRSPLNSSDSQERVASAPSWCEKVYEFFRSFVHPTKAPSEPAWTIPPFFFKLERADIPASEPVYILGVHSSLAPNELPPEVLSKIESCKVLICSPPVVAKTSKVEFATFIRLMQKQFEDPDVEGLKKMMQPLLIEEEMQDKLITDLRKRIEEYRIWRPHWTDQLTLQVRQRLEIVLSEYGLKLEELHPQLVCAVLQHRISLPKTPSLLEVELKQFKEKNQTVHVIENNFKFSSKFEDFIFDWTEVFSVKELTSYLTQVIPVIDEAAIGEKSDYDQFAKEKVNLSSIQASETDSLTGMREQLEWYTKLTRLLLDSTQSTVVLVPYPLLFGQFGLIPGLERLDYRIGHFT
jgi:hypothetical protein